MAAKEGTRPDFGTFLGLALAGAGIVGGLILEKGNIRDIAQSTAALIVLGGTLGAVLVTSPLANVLSAISYLKVIFFERSVDAAALVDDVIVYATKARKQGIVLLGAIWFVTVPGGQTDSPGYSRCGVAFATSPPMRAPSTPQRSRVSRLRRIPPRTHSRRRGCSASRWAPRVRAHRWRTRPARRRW